MFIEFLLILGLLLLIPPLTKRLLGLPLPFTQIVMGILLGPLVLNLLSADSFIALFSSLGIVTIFLLAGIDLEIDPLLRKKHALLQNLGLQMLVLLSISALIYTALDLSTQQSLLFALALVSPSASYIFSCLRTSRIHTTQKEWIISMTLTGEIAAIIIMILISKAHNPFGVLQTFILIGALVAILPKILSFIYRRIFQSMPGSQVGIVFLLAMTSALITEHLGAHFIVGAFVAGVTARKFLGSVGLSHHGQNQIIDGIHGFIDIFAPFYFFFVGLTFTAAGFQLKPLLFGLLLSISVLGTRMLLVIAHRIKSKEITETLQESVTIATFTAPTMVFTFVVAEMLRDQFMISETLYGSLIVFGVLGSFTPMIGPMINPWVQKWKVRAERKNSSGDFSIVPKRKKFSAKEVNALKIKKNKMEA